MLKAKRFVEKFAGGEDRVAAEKARVCACVHCRHGWDMDPDDPSEDEVLRVARETRTPGRTDQAA